ncbi:cbb3-type cytochrome oxidase assembly protein CcoS [Pelagibacterium mangrovi]|uniref:cbb3-type cytochrome oxidase assembly protein CcoS n=1 Tax=Pelagibacterium mangrovi TaxID=3119828 RepID=UPI002FC82395
MDRIFFLIPLGLIMGLVGLLAFLWSLRSGQYDDLQGAAERILLDDEDNEKKEGAGNTR